MRDIKVEVEQAAEKGVAAAYAAMCESQRLKLWRREVAATSLTKVFSAACQAFRPGQNEKNEWAINVVVPRR